MNTKLKNLLFILILGSVCTGLLVGIKSYTTPKIERYNEVRLRSTILDAAAIDYEKTSLDEVFNTKIRKFKKDGLIFYMSPDNLYIFTFEGRGLWGMIEGAIALRRDLKTIENLRIISQEETPGLGGRISEQGFLGQFKNKQVSPKLFLALRRKAQEANEVDAITGASMTSEALIDMVNESVINFRNNVGKGDPLGRSYR